MSALVIVAGIIAVAAFKLLDSDKHKDGGKVIAGIFLVVLVMLTLFLMSMGNEDQ